MKSYQAVIFLAWVATIQTALVTEWFSNGTVWHNELGSTMTLTEVNIENGSFAGKYNSAVGNAVNEYDLSGRFDTNGSSLGWVVTYHNSFRNAKSTCTWSGQIQTDEAAIPRPIIHTTWLLTRQTSVKDNWKSTHVGFNTFTSFKEQKAKKRIKRSCPKEA